jgi:predicted nucleotidyltransferase
MTETEASRIEEQLRAFFQVAHHDLIAVYLYGSVARGRFSAGSDVDVAILFPRPPPKTFEALPFQLENELEKRLGRTVQAVVLNQASPDLCHRVFRDGKLILDRDPGSRIRFEVKARNDYFDLLPIIQRYRRGPTKRPIEKEKAQ